MNIKRAKEEIKNTIEAYLWKDEYGSYVIPVIRQRPVLLIGPPGVGKTQIMEQIAQETQIGLISYTITHHTRQSAIGLPFIAQKNYDGHMTPVTEYTMSEIVASIYDKIDASGLKEGILFIDEINCVSETLAPTMLQFLQCKTFGNHKIPQGWVIVAAGNPPEFNKSVRDFDIVTLDRIKMIHVEGDFEVWKEYANQVEIHPAIISYLSIKQQYFCLIETTVDGKLFATPRGWEDLSRLVEVYEKLGKDIDRDVIYQYIQHAKIAKDFANYLELYYKYQNEYQVEEILHGVIREPLCHKIAKAPFDEKLSVISLLLAKLNGYFREVVRKEQFLELLMERLKMFHRKGSGNEECAWELFEEIIAGIQVEINHKKEAGLLARKEEYLYRDVKVRLENYLQMAKTQGAKEFLVLWEYLRGLFGQEREEYEAMVSLGEKMLEYAFDFMEATFADSQEMVVFITELNTNYHCVKFLQEYHCERYIQYNKKLLFEENNQELLKRIEK